MKKLIKSIVATSVLLASSLPVSSALATESDHFMSCHGAHHGWYLDFYAVSPFGEDASIFILMLESAKGLSSFGEDASLFILNEVL